MGVKARSPTGDKRPGALRMLVLLWYNTSMNTTPKAHKITVELPHDLWESVRALADEHQRSFVKELVWALQEYVKRERRSRPSSEKQ